MPGYLTHAMVLIRMVGWLRELRSGIKDRRDAGKPLSALDVRLDDLARQTLVYITEETNTQPQTLRALTRIANGVGDGISKYAFVGSLGPDIATAGNILALNQEWASRQLHRGGPRRAYEKAKSTTLVLTLLELAEKFEREPRTTGLRRRDTIAYALGHLSHIAADVMLHPAVHELADQGQLDPLKHREFELALDARVAHGFFQREDLHEGDSWEEYYVDLDDHREPLTRLMGDLSEAFKATYGDVTPNAAVCALPDRTKCLAPKFEAEFLINGYRNTTKWALDAGYDHGPQGLNVLWTLAIVGTALLSALWLGIGTNTAWTWTNLIAGANAKDIADASRDSKDDWEKHGVQIAHAWRDIVDEALNWSGRALMPFAFILGGDLWMYPLTVWQASDGVFGQGTQDPWKKDPGRAFAAFAFPIKDVGLFVFGEVDVEHTQTHEYKWIVAVAELALEVVDHLLKLESRKSNIEGDRLAHAMFFPRLLIAGSHLLGNAATMVWKHNRKKGDGLHPVGIHGEDFVFPLILSGLTAGIAVWATGWFTDHILKHTAGAPWPSADSGRVNSRLAVEVIGDKRKLFPPADRSLDFKVRLFPAATADAGGAYFPEDTTIAADEFDKHASHDIAVRREALKPWDDEKYTLPELFEHAAQFAGLLGMAAVSYNEAAPPVRQHMTAIFKDWNLDFQSVQQWKELMEVDSTSGTPVPVGVLRASQRYTLDLAARVDTLDQKASEILRAALGVTEVAGAIHADFARTGEALDTIDRASAQSVRLTRPGAILLANLDIEKVPPVAAPLPSRVGLLDAHVDDKVNIEGNDKDELTRFQIRKPGAAGSPHELVLRLNAADAARVRIFEVTAGTPDTWPVRLGATSGGVIEEYPLPPGDPAVVAFAIEAKWLTGDPSIPPATGPGPISPLPFAPAGVVSGAPTVDKRKPNEIWLEVLHKEGGAIVPGIRDTAVFTVAPFLLIPNTQPVERLWMVYIPDSLTRLRINFIPPVFAATDERSPGNHPTVADVFDALNSDPLLSPRLTDVTRQPPPSGEFDRHKPLAATDPANAKLLYLIDAPENLKAEIDTIEDLGGVPPLKRRIRQTVPDQWVQDAFELGYTSAPHARIHVALQNPRTTLADGLGKFIDCELPAENRGLFARLPVQTDSADYGGNIECSLPVSVTTPVLPDGAAGPLVPEQKPATHGKIILGEGVPHLFDIADSFAAGLSGATVSAPLVAEFKSHNLYLGGTVSVKEIEPGRRWHLTTGGIAQYELRRTGGHVAVHLYRGVMEAYRTFLEQQGVQPIVNIDMSWLDVGHVDEVMAIVPDTAHQFRLVVANSRLAVDILKAAQDLHDTGPAAHPLTRMFRRRKWASAPEPESIAQAQNASQTVKKAWDRGHVFNEKVQTLRLGPIRDRLAAALGIGVADIIEVPVMYDSLPDPLMSHLGAFHWKPSVPPATAEKITIMRTAAYVPNQANVQVVNNHILIPRPFGPRMKPADVVAVLTTAGVAGVALGDLAGLDTHDSWERKGTAVANIAASYGVAAAAIKGHPDNATKFTGADTVKNNWDRIRIPEGRVDLFEACTRARLKPTGATVHFIDTWDWYHSKSGDIHCGTNAQRTPMENDPAFPKWWNAEAMRG